MENKTVIDFLGKDVIGSTISQISIFNYGCPQAVSSYDDGKFLVIEYITKDGEKKVFSIIGIRADKYDPPSLMDNFFVLNNTETQKYYYIGSASDLDLSSDATDDTDDK